MEQEVKITEGTITKGLKRGRKLGQLVATPNKVMTPKAFKKPNGYEMLISFNNDQGIRTDQKIFVSVVDNSLSIEKV